MSRSLSFLCCILLAVNGEFMMNDTDAMTFEITGKISDFLRILYRGEDYMLIGSRNQITNLSLATMTYTHTYNWPPRQSDQDKCQLQPTESGPLAHICTSVYPRSVQKVTENRYLLCGSNPFKSNCREFNYTVNSEGQGEWNIHEVNWTVYHHKDPQLPRKWEHNEYVFTAATTPIHPYTDLFMVASEDLVYYTATIKDQHNQNPIPIMYKLPKYPRYNNNNSSAMSIVQNNKGIFNFDTSKERAVQPIAIFAHLFLTQYSVFNVFSELAMEVYGQNQRHARIARVCRNDPGDRVELPRFVTFTKARLLCGSFQEVLPNRANQEINRLLKPNFGYTFNLVAHATDPHDSRIGGRPELEKILVAVFNADSALFNGTAVCAYRMADIESSFDNGKILNITDSPVTIREATVATPKCNAATSNNMGDSLDNLAVNVFLLKNQINPINKFPLFYQFATSYRYTKIAIHYGVEDAAGKHHDIIFIATDDGTLLQLVNITGEYELIEQRQIFKGEAIKEMELVHIVEHDRPYLMMNSLRQMKRVGLEKCHRHLKCAECVSVRNPYCSWSPSQKSCIASHHNATDRIQNLITGLDDRCIIEDKNNATTTEQTPESTTTPIYVEQGKIIEKPDSNTDLVAGVAVAVSLVFGILGFAAGWFFSKRRQRSPTKNLDDLSGSRNKGDILDADKLGNYESKQLNTLHKYTLNNGEVIVNDTSVNDSTLARQKKSYV